MPKQKVKLICQCGKRFEVYLCRKNTAKYCSIKCQRQFRKYGQLKGTKQPNNSLAKLGKKNPMFGKLKKNPTLAALHQWLRKYKPKPIDGLCEKCKKMPYRDVAKKKEREYTRNFNDYLWLCKKCHIHYDDNYPPVGCTKGKKLSDKHKRKLSESHKGQIPWNKGLKTKQI